MAVGPRFLDPATQAAIAAQGGVTPPPAEPTPPTSPAEPQPPPEPASTPEPPAEPVPPAPEPPPAPAEPPPQEPTPPAEPEPSAETPTPEDVDKALKEAGFSNEDLGKELAANDGKLTAETIAKLKEHFDPEAVDNTLADLAEQWKERTDKVLTEGKKAVDAMNTFIYETLASGDAAKGKENFAILSAWAKENMPKEELEAINVMLKSGNQTVVKQGLEQAVNKWKAREKAMMSGDANVPAAPAAPEFEPLSKDQYIKIMCTKKYTEDADYRKQIDDRRRKTLEKGEGFITPEYSHLRPPI